MRVVVTGATGNIGTSLTLGEEPSVDAIVGMVRRQPEWQPAKTSVVAADITNADLVEHFHGDDHHQAGDDRVGGGPEKG